MRAKARIHAAEVARSVTSILNLIYRPTSSENFLSIGVIFVENKGCFLAYNTKIIETPTTKEIWIYEKPVFRQSEEDNTTCHIKATRKTFDELSAKKQAISLQRKQKYYKEKRWEIARLIDCNYDNQTKFLSMSFKENIQDIDYTNKQFKNFIQRLNYYQFNTKTQKIKYIATWEYQKRGAIHYHLVLFDFPFIQLPALNKLWGHGTLQINRVDVDGAQSIGRYISKYFSKDLALKEHKKKAFFKSQNLKIPKETKLMLTDDILADLQKENIIFQKEYTRQIYDTKSLISNGTYLKDSGVTYIKIRKERDRYD